MSSTRSSQSCVPLALNLPHFLILLHVYSLFDFKFRQFLMFTTMLASSLHLFL
uniref:Uncharacterized protein n=1 Tax=Anguilla anguilla TaxID=7936 RepID=A0A0E9WFV2_ANGAN